MKRCRFLQLSDLHFGAPMTSSKLDLPPEKLAQRRQDFGSLVDRIPSLVTEQQVDIVLLPGDLFDCETVDQPETLKDFRQLYEMLSKIEIPVVITPGNHDYYSPGSFYHPETLLRLLGTTWPENIHIFREKTFQPLLLPFGDGEIQVTGRAFHDNYQNTEDARENHARLLAELSPRQPSTAFDLLLFHGSRDDFNRADEKMTAPFSKDELLALNFDYVAVGHYHRKDVFTTPSGEIKGAYAGCPFARGLDETGPKVILLGEMTKEGSAPAKVTLFEEITLDPRKIIHESFNLLDTESLEEIETRIQKRFSESAQPADMLYITLTGFVQPGIGFSVEKLAETLGQKYFHVKVNDDKLTESYHLEQFQGDSSSLEGRFLQAIEAQRATASPEEQEALKLALYLGLDAITGRKVRTP